MGPSSEGGGPAPTPFLTPDQIKANQFFLRRSISGAATLTHLNEFSRHGLQESLRGLVVSQGGTHEMPNVFLDAMRLEAGLRTQGKHTSITGVPGSLLPSYYLYTELYRKSD